jgi:hypothetical protein
MRLWTSTNSACGQTMWDTLPRKMHISWHRKHKAPCHIHINISVSLCPIDALSLFPLTDSYVSSHRCVPDVQFTTKFFFAICDSCRLRGRPVASHPKTDTWGRSVTMMRTRGTELGTQQAPGAPSQMGAFIRGTFAIFSSTWTNIIHIVFSFGQGAARRKPSTSYYSITVVP